jgi:tetratricopeptide (TPR) repeat protein
MRKAMAKSAARHQIGELAPGAPVVAAGRGSIAMVFAAVSLLNATASLSANPAAEPEKEATPPPAVRQTAEARDGGIAVNANGQNVHVEVHEERDPEVVRLLKSLQKGQKALEDAVSDLRRDGQERQRLLDERADGVEQVLRKTREPHPSATALTAISDLEAGSSLGAEALLQESERAAAAKRPPDVSRAAQLARQQGALATFRNTESALAAYQRAAAYEPDNPDNWKMVGDLLMDSLRRPEATKAYERLRTLATERLKEEPTNIARRSALAASYRNLADALMAQDEVEPAVQMAQKGLELAQKWVSEQPWNSEARRGLLTSLMQIGSVRVEEARAVFFGKADAAIPPGGERMSAMRSEVQRLTGESETAYRDALALVDKLLGADTTHEDLWLDRAWCQIGIGWALALNSHRGAQGEFLRGVETLERIANKDPASADYQHALALGYKDLGGFFVSTAKNPLAARMPFEKSLSILEILVRQNPFNPRWRLDLVIAYQDMASLAQADTGMPSLADFNSKPLLSRKPPVVDPATAIPLLDNGLLLLKQLDAGGLLMPSERGLQRQFEFNREALQCQQRGFLFGSGGECYKRLPPIAP